DDLTFTSIERGKISERVVESYQLPGTLFCQSCGLVERKLRRSTTALGIVTGTRVIYQNVAHHLCRHGKEVRAILPLDILLIDELQICLINQCRSLQSVRRILSVHVAFGQPAQFGIDERNQLFQSGLITLAPVHQQLSYFLGEGRHNAIPSLYFDQSSDGIMSNIPAADKLPKLVTEPRAVATGRTGYAVVPTA